MKTLSSSSFQPSTPLQYLIHFLEGALHTINHSPKVTASAIQKALSLAKGLDPYLEKHASLKENPTFDQLIQTLATKTQTMPWGTLYEQGKISKKLKPVMMTGNYEGKLLKMLAQMINATHILEIGMFTGYATLMLASALPEKGYIITCEDEPFLVTTVKPFFEASGYEHQIQIRTEKALDTLKTLIEENYVFDMIFIDANKAEYVDYFLAIKQGNLLADNGMICVDNTLMKGMVYATKAKKTPPAKEMMRFNQLVAKDPDFEQIILPVRDGLSLIRKKATS